LSAFDGERDPRAGASSARGAAVLAFALEALERQARELEQAGP
jgi:hypothetical protein